MKPTRIIAAPYFDNIGPKGSRTLIIPTDQGDLTLRDLADTLGMPCETLRCRITGDKWQRDNALQCSHQQAKDGKRGYTPGSYIPRGSRKREPETIPIGKVERHNTYEDWKARREAFLKTLPARDAEYRDYLKAHKAMCR